jgi:uncharacterized protein YqgC (DUF456 family)
MKNFVKAIRFMLATLLIVIVSQATVLAQSNDSSTASSGLSVGQIVGGFAVLLFVILVPLLKSHKASLVNKK